MSTVRTITRREFELMAVSIRGDLLPGIGADTAVRRQLRNAGIEVERTPEERITDFVVEARRHYTAAGICLDLRGVVEAAERNFPEVRDRA